MPAATAYTLTAPTTPSGNVDVASGNFTVTINGTNTGVVITPAASTSNGTFSPTTVTCTTGAPAQTFTYTPITVGAITVTTTNGGSLTDPAGVVYTCVAQSTTAYSVLKNPTGASRRYPYLGVRGITIAAGAHYSYPGSVYLAARNGWNYRDFNDFMRNLVAGTIEIVSTPGVIVKEGTTGLTKVLADANDAFAVTDPSWGSEAG